MKTEGIVLAKRSSYNTDVFLTLFTQKYGKLDVIAKRSKSYKSKLNASSRSFVCSEYLLKAASVPIVMSADIVSSNLSIMDNYDALASASYLSELVMKTTREEHAEPRLYHMLKSALAFLAEGSVSPRLIRTFFVTKLCVELGVMPEMTHCFACGGEGAEDDFLSVEHGRLCKECVQGVCIPSTGRLFRFLIYMQQSDISRAPAVRCEPFLMDKAAGFSERLLQYHLDIGEIKSKELITLG